MSAIGVKQEGADTVLAHDARLMPAKYVRPYSKGQRNDFRDAEAIAEAVQRPTMKFVTTKSAEQLDLQALHRVRERLVSQRTCTINQIRAFSWPPWISARVRAHCATGLDRASWVTSVRRRREDRTSISSHPLADLGGKVISI